MTEIKTTGWIVFGKSCRNTQVESEQSLKAGCKTIQIESEQNIKNGCLQITPPMTDILERARKDRQFLIELSHLDSSLETIRDSIIYESIARRIRKHLEENP